MDLVISVVTLGRNQDGIFFVILSRNKGSINSNDEQSKIRAGKYDNYKVIDLAEVNDIRTDTELIEMYDEFWDMFHLGELDKYCGCKPSNGYHIISGVDIKDKITLELSLFQREMVEDVLYAVVTEYCEGDFLLRKDKNLDIKNLVDQVLHTKRAKKKFKNWQLDRTAN